MVANRFRHILTLIGASPSNGFSGPGTYRVTSPLGLNLHQATSRNSFAYGVVRQNWDVEVLRDAGDGWFEVRGNVEWFKWENPPSGIPQQRRDNPEKVGHVTGYVCGSCMANPVGPGPWLVKISEDPAPAPAPYIPQYRVPISQAVQSVRHPLIGLMPANKFRPISTISLTPAVPAPAATASATDTVIKFYNSSSQIVIPPDNQAKTVLLLPFQVPIPPIGLRYYIQTFATWTVTGGKAPASEFYEGNYIGQNNVEIHLDDSVSSDSSAMIVPAKGIVIPPDWGPSGSLSAESKFLPIIPGDHVAELTMRNRPDYKPLFDVIAENVSILVTLKLAPLPAPYVPQYRIPASRVVQSLRHPIIGLISVNRFSRPITSSVSRLSNVQTVSQTVLRNVSSRGYSGPGFYAVSSPQGLNIRSAPSSNSTSLGVIGKNGTVQVIRDAGNGWVYVVNNIGQQVTGFMCMSCIAGGPWLIRVESESYDYNESLGRSDSVG